MKIRSISLGIIVAILLTILSTTLVSADQLDSGDQWFVVPAGYERNLYILMLPGDQVSGVFCENTGRDIKWRVVDPYGMTVQWSPRLSGCSSFTFVAQTYGYYRMVFDNGYSLVRDKVVTVRYSYPWRTW